MADNNNDARIAQLYAELLDNEQRRKDAAAGFREEAKRLKAELKELVREERHTDDTD